MRGGVVDRRPVPAGVNLAPPLRFWKLSGGAVYLPEEDAVLMTSIGSTLTSPPIRVDRPTALTWQEQVWYPIGTPPATHRLMSMTYLDAELNPVGSNGNGTRGAATESEVWLDSSHRLGASAANGMTGSVYEIHAYSVNQTYGVPGMKFRATELIVTR